jgi:hypothetical protein
MQEGMTDLSEAECASVNGGVDTLDKVAIGTFLGLAG